MKMWKLALMAGLFIGVVFPLQAQFTFVTNNNTIVITGYTGQPTSLTIPGTTNNLPVIIGDNLFFNSSLLTNLTLLDGVESIGTNAFQGCANLRSVTIPGSVTNIGPYAFNFCQNLTNCPIPNGVLNIDEGAFRLTKLPTIIIPGSVVTIGAKAFYGDSPQTVTISNGVENIGDSAFYSCLRFQSVMIPASVRSIGMEAFADCPVLTNIQVDASNSNYASAAGVLFDKSLGTLVECPALPNGLQNYAIPAGVTNIGLWAFEETALDSMTIPNSVSSISDNAFEGCYVLPSLAIPASVTHIGTNVFDYCLALTNITVDPANPDFVSTNGVLFDRTFGTLIAFPAGKSGNYVVPDSVSTIASTAFGYSHLTNVVMGNNVKTIGPSAFVESSILNMTIPASARNISSYAFFNCFYLTNVTILNGITVIDPWAFSACFKLATVTLPASVQSLGSFTFDGCTSLTNVFFSGDAPAADSTAFFQLEATIYYLPGASGWSNTFAGLPTTPWYLANPAILNASPALRRGTNPFSFTISWATNGAVVVEASTNLIAWQPVQTNTLSAGSAAFSDTQWTNFPSRYYRLRSP